MTTAEQWTQALTGKQDEGFLLRFERLGLEAQCRPLTSEEVEECVRMGGERGLRYALYLSCGGLREAGESLRRQGQIGSPFDITQSLTYGDVVAAGRAILQRSGTGTGGVSAQGGFVGEESPAILQMLAPEAQYEGKITPKGWTGEEMWGESPHFPTKEDHWALADKLLAAWGNR